MASAAIVWPDPVIHDREMALEATGCHIERLRSLMSAILDGIVEDVRPDQDAADEIYSAYMQLRIADEKLGEVDRVVQAIIRAAPAPQSSVAKHTDIMRRRNWIAAVGAWKAANAVPAPEDNDEFIKVGETAAAAFQDMIATLSPDIRAFHEKLTLIEGHDGWGVTGTSAALLADIERFARAEIAAQKLEG